MPSKLTKWAFKAVGRGNANGKGNGRWAGRHGHEHGPEVKLKCRRKTSFDWSVVLVCEPPPFCLISPYIWHLSALCQLLLLLLMLASLRNESNLNFLIVCSSGRPKAVATTSVTGVRDPFAILRIIIIWTTWLELMTGQRWSPLFLFLACTRKKVHKDIF